jgi:Cdc6-like AAA superfamily ATPase
MDDVTALYRELDPMRPLRGDEDALYVDWQRRLDPDGMDAKSRLVNMFRRNASAERPVTRLLTGHRGCGKTTELNRVRDALSGAQHERRVFVSMLFADEWLDLEDVQPEDLVLQIVRQLAGDLSAAGVGFGEQELKAFFASLWKRAKGTKLDAVSVGADPLKFSFKLEHFPTARDEFRALLRGQLTTVFDLVNRELLPHARQELARDGYDDIVLIVDDLDRILRRCSSKAA